MFLIREIMYCKPGKVRAMLEKSLAMDNIFVIAMIFAALGVPAIYQHRVLFWGILGALVMRGEAGVEAEDQHRVRAGMGEQPLALVERGQPERRHVGLEEAHRVRVEGGDDDRPPLVRPALDGAALRRSS